MGKSRDVLHNNLIKDTLIKLFARMGFPLYWFCAEYSFRLPIGWKRMKKKKKKQDAEMKIRRRGKQWKIVTSVEEKSSDFVAN